MNTNIPTPDNSTIKGNQFLIKRGEYIISSSLMLQEALNIASYYAQNDNLLSFISDQEQQVGNFRKTVCSISEDILGSDLSVCSQNINDSIFASNHSQSSTEKDMVIKSWLSHKYKLYTIKLSKILEENDLPSALLELVDIEEKRAISVKDAYLNTQDDAVAA